MAAAAAAAASSSLQLLQCSSPANAQLRSCRNGGVLNPSVRKLKLASSNIEFTGRQRCRLHIEAYSVSGPCPTKLENTHQKQNPRQLASTVRPNPVQRTKSIRFSGRTLSSHFDTGTLSESAEFLVSNIDTMGLNESAEEKVGVLLLNLGGPETLQDVQPFLYNLFADPDIIRLPRLFRFLQQPLAQLISSLRAPKAKEGYAAIGGGSPLRQITDEQAKALKEALELKRTSALVYVAMRYWHPFTEEALDQIKRDKISKLVVLPLYPHFSISTTGSSLSVLYAIFRQDEYFRTLPYFVIKSWYQREGYIRAMSKLIEKELQKFPSSNEVMLFFSAHGVPCSYVEKYHDPYKSQMEECVGLIMKELKARGIGNEHILAYQSRVGPVEWLKPYTDETIVQLGQKGVKSLLVIPISFVSEHIETLEEIDGEYKHLALNSGIKHWGRVPALGCEPSFIADLADAIIEALPLAAAVTPSRLVAGQTDSELKYTIGSILSLGLVLGSKFVRLILRFLGLQPYTS